MRGLVHPGLIHPDLDHHPDLSDSNPTSDSRMQVTLDRLINLYIYLTMYISDVSVRR